MIDGSLQLVPLTPSRNLSDLASVTTAQTNLGATATPTANSLVLANGSGVIDAGWVPSLDASKIGSGTLVHERGGLEADVSAYSGLVHISAGATSAKTLSANGETLIGHTFSQMRTDLSLVPGTDVQGYNAGLADISGLAKTDSNIIVGNGTNWVAESGATARTSLGLGAGDSVQHASVFVTDGTASPFGSEDPIQITARTTTVTSGFRTALGYTIYANPSGSSSAQYRATTASVAVTAGNSQNLTHSTAGLCALSLSVQTGGTGVISNTAAVLVPSPFRTSTGTIGNAVALRLQAQKAAWVTNGYAVYSEGTSDQNYFANNILIGSATAPTSLSKGIAIANGAKPTGAYSGAGLVADSGELNVWDSAGNFTVISPHSIDAAMAAGIKIDLEADPVPDVFCSENVYSGKRKYRYVAPNGDTQTVYVDIPAERIRDWEEDQLELTEMSRRAIRQWYRDREAFNESIDDLLRPLSEEAHKKGKRLRDVVSELPKYAEPCPEMHTRKDPPAYLRGRMVKTSGASVNV